MLHRKIKDHWIWESDHRFKWWVDILLTVNHSDSKVLIKGRLIECSRGQSVMSLETWGKRWNVTKKTVKDFFELLQKDSMLVYEGLQITTRITVCNYDSYQKGVNAEETKGKRRVNADETETTPKQECKEGNNDNKERKVIPPSLEMIKEYCILRGNNISSEEFFNHYTATGWMMGKSKMKDWQATVRTWESKDREKNKVKKPDWIMP